MANTEEEVDFLSLHQPQNDNNDHSSSLQPSPSPPPPRPLLDRRRSFSGMISKINPELVKSVIASASTNSNSQPSPHLPLSGTSTNDRASENAPLTIIYKGTVSVFDLPHHKANDIIKYAMDQNGSKSEALVKESCFKVQNDNNIVGELNDGDLPIKRKKSLQRFFEKRRERLICVSPYANHVVDKSTV